MSNTITFTGLASGMDTASWVEALVNIKKSTLNSLTTKQSKLSTQQSAVSSIQSSFNSLRTSLEKITDSKFGGTFDLFAKTKTSSTADSFVSASSSSGAATGSYELSVKQLATATVAMADASALALKEESLMSSISSDVAALADGKTLSFNIYAGGVKHNIEVGKDDKVSDVLDKINGIDGINASISGGKVSISSDDGVDVVIGSSTDSLNIAKDFALLKNENGNYESFHNLTIASSSDKIAEVLGETAQGSFTIGDAEFTIDENTTFDDLIAEINSSEDAGVTAAFDKTTGQLSFTAKTNGSFNINIEKGSSDFTDLLGFTSTNSETGVTALNSQELGSFAIFSIDGDTKISSSNAVTSDISGIKGVTFNLHKVSDEDNPTTTIKVSQDTSDLLSAVKDFIEKYNSTLDLVDKETASDGDLYGDTTLNSIRNSLRSASTAKDAGASVYNMLSQIGISTGAASSDISKLSDHLELDEKKFLEAFESNPDAVKNLLIGSDNNTGVLTKLENTVEQSLKSNGYFTTRNNSIDKQITNLKTSISNENLKIDAYQARLEKQFQNLESMVSSFQSSYNSVLSMI
ncbi:flagellar filament capping protein FliD [bacterium]|nr:flagellar filament capping protein FliD [bacterium]